MIKNLLTFTLLCFALSTIAQHTFSIVAIDTITGEVGSAGASCVDDSDPQGGAIIISRLIPGVAALHTQAFYHKENQENFYNQVKEGHRSLESTIIWLTQHDIEGFHSFRQYSGVAMRDGELEVYAVTGDDVLPEKGDIVGPNYAIAGNILKNKDILTKMENGFLNASGTLADKLLGALREAKEIGADARCEPNNVSSLSAFLRVARPTDEEDKYFLDLYVPSVPEFIDPIDSLLNLYDQWLKTTSNVKLIRDDQIKLYPNPVQNTIQIELAKLSYHEKTYELSDYLGKIISKGPLQRTIYLDNNISNGIYILNIKSKEGIILFGEKIMIQ